MESVIVHTTTDGMINICQPAGSSGQDVVIRIAPDQVDSLVAWLQTAKSTLSENTTATALLPTHEELARQAADRRDARAAELRAATNQA